ncbi:MAG: hypothetical protein KDD82_21175 [Planctomycetes bacterium]|nr:hypothetical protein [Planctomycetota bacterium]
MAERPIEASEGYARMPACGRAILERNLEEGGNVLSSESDRLFIPIEMEVNARWEDLLDQVVARVVAGFGPQQIQDEVLAAGSPEQVSTLFQAVGVALGELSAEEPRPLQEQIARICAQGLPPAPARALLVSLEEALEDYDL